MIYIYIYIYIYIWAYLHENACCEKFERHIKILVLFNTYVKMFKFHITFKHIYLSILFYICPTNTQYILTISVS